ncbi:MAG: alpha/beta hydrolase [Gemmatimonadales bacterium]|nr:alpha/beta hydrolase [Gemmatimonadales bacterium]
MNNTLPTAETVPAPDGTPLAVRRWSAAAPRGHVVIVHGLGEHAGRYAHVAARVVAAGWRVSAFDLRGHGRSGGPRGGVRRADDHLRDLATVLDHLHPAPPGGAGRAGPLVLLGHSMGGQVAALFVARAVRPVDGLVLSSPALDAGLSWFQRFQVAVGHALAPDLAQSNRLDVDRISHDPQVVRAYRDDPLVHDRVTARTARAILDGGAEVLASAPAWRVPTLLLWAGADALVSPAGSAKFAATAPASVVRARCFDALYHEILNERDAEPVFAELLAWLEARAAGA